MMYNTRKRQTNEINAGSMADIAFLLLIFFLVTTTMVEDKGIFVRLPPWDPNPLETQVNTKNVFSVFVNANNELLANNESINIDKLKNSIKEFIMNPNHNVELPSNPKNAIISLRNDRATKYGAYLNVYNEIKAAYNELRNEAARSRFGKGFKVCSAIQRKEIKNYIPLILSEAEPTAYGEE